MVKILYLEDLNLFLGPIVAKIRGERDLNLILGCIVVKRRRRDRDSVASLRHLVWLLNWDQTNYSQPAVLTDLMPVLVARDL